MRIRKPMRVIWLLAPLVAGCEEPITHPGLTAATGATALPAAPRPDPNHGRIRGPRPQLTAAQRLELSEWLGAVGERRNGETFGDLIVRAARRQLQKPYDNFRQTSEEETLHVDLEAFQCVSLVESSLAIARCIWLGKPNEECFLADLEASRYRGGRLGSYSSRLHYFPDWIDDNRERGRLESVTTALGGTPTKHVFSFMTAHRGLYPPLANPEVFEQIRSREEELSDREWAVLERDKIPAAEGRLQTGDIVALVSTKKNGLLIGHTGFVDKSPEGVPRLLHASSYHQRVLLTAGGIAEYAHRRPDRRGIMVARPLPPPL